MSSRENNLIEKARGGFHILQDVLKKRMNEHKSAVAMMQEEIKFLEEYLKDPDSYMPSLYSNSVAVIGIIKKLKDLSNLYSLDDESREALRLLYCSLVSLIEDSLDLQNILLSSIIQGDYTEALALVSKQSDDDLKSMIDKFRSRVPFRVKGIDVYLQKDDNQEEIVLEQQIEAEFPFHLGSLPSYRPDYEGGRFTWKFSWDVYDWRISLYFSRQSSIPQSEEE